MHYRNGVVGLSMSACCCNKGGIYIQYFNFFYPKENCGVEAQERGFCFQLNPAAFYYVFIICRLLGFSFVYAGENDFYWLTSVGCWVLTVDCRVLLSVIVVGSLLSGVGCRVWVVTCWLPIDRLSLSFSIVGAQLCPTLFSSSFVFKYLVTTSRFLSS